MALLLTLVLILQGSSFLPKGQLADEYFSVSQTKALKGIFAVCIVFHHLSSYLGDSFSSLLLFKDIGFVMVGGFFFISGYGLCFGVLNKSDYMKGFLLKRFLPVFFTYTVIDLSYWACKYSINMLNLKYMVKTFFALNDNLWFASVIIWLYLVFFICFKLFKGKPGIVVMTVCVVLYMAVLLYIYRYTSFEIKFGFWWYNSIPCFATGMWYCCYKDKINSHFKKMFLPYSIIFPVITVISFSVSVNNPDDYARLYVLSSQIICGISFSLSVVVWSIKIRLGGKILSLLGDLSFELYLFHAVFIWFFRSGLTFFGYTVYITAEDRYLTAIIVATFVFSYIVSRLRRLVFKKVLTPQKAK